MEKISLAIWDMDSTYSKALATFITNHHEEFVVKVLYDRGNLLDHIKQQLSDIYLVNEKVSKDIHGNNGVVIYLVEEIKKNDKEDTLTGTIFKYREADEIVQAIQFYYELLSGSKMGGISSTGKMIGFFSSAGGVGKTVVALGVARTLASYGKKVLYLNLESIPSTNLFFSSHKESKCLSDFLYYLFIKEGQKEIKSIHEFTCRDEWGVHSFVPQGSYNDLINLTSSEMCHFLDTLCREIDFEYICVDTTSTLDENNALVCSMCHKVFNISTESMICKEKQEVFNHYYNVSSKLTSFQNSILVLNRHTKKESLEHFTILEDENLNKGIYLNGPFGSGIKKIVENVLFE